MTEEQALSETLPLIEFAERAIGGDWEKIDLGAQGRALPSGKTGTMQGAGRLGPGVPAADQIRTSSTGSRKNGVDTATGLCGPYFLLSGVSRSRGFTTHNVGRDHDQVYLELMVATTGSTVDSRTRCRRRRGR